MRKLSLLTIVLVLLITLIAPYASAQSFYAMRQQRDLIVSLGLNTSTYYGDLKDDGDILDIKPSLSLGAMYNVTNRIGLRGEISWITFSGSDNDSEDRHRIRRNLSFKSSNIELAISGTVSLLPQSGRFYQRPLINPYGMIGIGALYFNPKATLNGTTYALQPLQTEGVDYNRVTMVIPYGLGVRVKASPFVNICIEAAWRKTFTDYLDDVSTVYKDNNSFTSDIARELADRRTALGFDPHPEGARRGNPDNDDSYMLMSAKIEYYLPVRIGSGQNKLYNKKRKSYYRRR